MFKYYSVSIIKIIMSNSQDNPNSKSVVNVEEGKSILYFTASWCGPCQKIKPIYESVKKQYDSNIKFYKMDLSNNQDIADKLKVTSIPTFFFINDGQLMFQFTGGNESLLKSYTAKLSSL
jgi:thiol-disulfide isomerase/thioredoxin